MADRLVIEEGKGDKIYKLITIMFPSGNNGIKIISKEDFNETIHCCMHSGTFRPKTGEFTNMEIVYKSPDEGLTKEDFEGFSQVLLSKAPEETEVIVEDLSKYKTLKEQLRIGMHEKFMKVIP
ncbi:MAG: hypothetical protein HY758_10375 [Nitrospirae bacterium]|nr:hypothetical protein [Nitrospirota bacterium]